MSCRTSRTRAMITACSGALRPRRVNRAGLVTKWPKCQDCNRWRAAFSKKPVRGAVARAETAILVARVAYAAGKTRPANQACLRAQGIEGLAISPLAWAHAVCALWKQTIGVAPPSVFRGLHNTEVSVFWCEAEGVTGRQIEARALPKHFATDLLGARPSNLQHSLCLAGT